MVKRLLPHICLILSIMMIAFNIADGFNPGMDFLGNGFFKVIFLIYAVLTIFLSAFSILKRKK